MSCVDGPGIVAGVASALARRGLNIVDLDQHSSEGLLVMRLLYEGDHEPVVLEAELRSELARIAPAGFELFVHPEAPRRVALMASREEHCLRDQLSRFAGAELAGEVGLVISNHPDHQRLVEGYGAPYHCVPVEPDAKSDSEERALALLGGVDLLILARYMQVLSAEFLERLEAPVINIHHSFLPAFAGADPYRRAHERGVKLIGATAHFATAELDAGPIIAQATAPVSHRDEVTDLVRIGRDLERVVLADAVRAHLEDRVLVIGDRTIVF